MRYRLPLVVLVLMALPFACGQAAPETAELSLRAGKTVFEDVAPGGIIDVEVLATNLGARDLVLHWAVRAADNLTHDLPPALRLASGAVEAVPFSFQAPQAGVYFKKHATVVLVALVEDDAGAHEAATIEFVVAARGAPIPVAGVPLALIAGLAVARLRARPR